LGDATRHLRSEYVLCDSEGKRLDPWRATRALESALQRAGIEKRGGPFNLMRHTFGSRLAEAGVPMATIAKIMGNSSAVCERHYIRFSPGHLKAAMATLDETEGGAQDGARTKSIAIPGAIESLQVVDS
ncbi:MAG: tyrosine-type recombinase/integrase, partial [Acidobacteria bacterium]|nr:tyrosine-type recombinase/integrase [Acidobacteriota bacterium]